jgi:hypothetical protein
MAIELEPTPRRSLDVRLGDLAQAAAICGYHIRARGIAGDVGWQLFFDSGGPTHCEYGGLTGSDALYALLAQGEGTYGVDLEVCPLQRTIMLSWPEVCCEAKRLAADGVVLRAMSSRKPTRPVSSAHM